jgi:enterochelin esterase-like enzyme
VGLGDRLVLAENRQFHRLLSEKGVNHQYQEDSGGHDWGLWGRQLPGHMEFLARNIK